MTKLQAQASKLPASEIPVHDANFILFWPLVLCRPAAPSRTNEIDAAVKDAAQKLREDYARAPAERQARLWSPVDDPLLHIAPPCDTTGPDFAVRKIEWANDVYAESVYFHEFVQSFLFQEPSCGDAGFRPFHLFRRTDIRAVEVVWGRRKPSKDDPAGSEGVRKKLIVERLNLYLFRTGVAIVVSEYRKDEDQPWTLAETQDFHDYFRRAYAPYFLAAAGGPARAKGGLVVDEVVWLGEAGARLAWPSMDGRSAFRIEDAFADVDRLIVPPPGRSRRPPLFDHWRVLLEGALPLAGYAPEDADVWRHVVDERMPTSAAVSVTAAAYAEDAFYRLIRPGDFMRLAFADSSGSGDFPYDAGFLKDFDRDHAYDRFASWGARYLVSGYAFVAVGAGIHFDKYIMRDMRRHYFQMMLLANLELAGILAVSGQITQAVAEQERQPDARRFERTMAAIQEEFLQFVHRFRFTGVSNQVQGQELYDLLRRRLRLDALFNDVQAEINNAAAYLRSRAQERASEAQTQLSLLAGIGVIVGVGLTILSSGFLLEEDSLKTFLLGEPRGLLSEPLDAARKLLFGENKLATGQRVVLGATFLGLVVLGGAGLLRGIRRFFPPPADDGPDAQTRLIATLVKAGFWAAALGAALWFATK